MSDKLILVLNCGSSSIKFTIMDSTKGNKYISGLAEFCYLSKITWISNYQKKEAILKKGIKYQEILKFIIENILKEETKILNKVAAIGHRIVHGGKDITSSVIINQEIIKNIENAISFAPLHIPAHLVGINETMKNFPQLNDKNVAVFDTTFHRTIPESSYLYALPYKLYTDHGIRRYGAHGISHLYVMQQAAKILKKTQKTLNIISCHLGNGSSISAIRNGICVDTSMGLTPLEGLVMGTRSGDIDPAIIFFLYNSLGMSIKEIDILLTQKSGLLGLTEITSDCRYIEDNYTTKEEAKRAMDVFCHRIAKYIGSYTTVMQGRLDALVFTGGIGENSAMVRDFVLKKLQILNFKIDYKLNLINRFGKCGYINKKNYRKILVIPTNEELIIAKETSNLIK
ncbi:acetate kinase [Candidatus Pantoea edessiphila]|uniref:Acetate kinase n=1 Tax=Candidatus Pantoea edessiphila TaxID=2044610 RepID=A0A2P5SYL1_9GAMM|nr:acetate kinase [Candidatus Pantoea edessiphila]MBK4775478.1 acetate kinase [Pantoea sp. Edef]PPI87393.1 acetate kinase [Candidatus Pantoea edessiphila]